MKKTIVTRNLVILTGLFFLGSCKKTDLQESSASETAKAYSGKSAVSMNREEDPEEVLYDDIVTASRIGFMKLRHNPEVARAVHDMVSEQFDGDDDVLLQDLDVKLRGMGIDLATEMNNSLEENGHGELRDKVAQAINGFHYNNTTKYMQIYIPEFGDYRNEVPTLVENHEADNDDRIEGISEDNAPVTIDEGYLRNKLTWVFSVNERLNRGTGGGGTGPGPWPTGNPAYTVQFKELKISNKKEELLNGKADIQYVIFRQMSPTTFSSVGMYLLCQTRDMTWTGVTGRNNSWIAPSSFNWAPGGGQIGILVYEADNRKRFDRTENVIPGYNATAVTYCSKEEKYGNILIQNPWAAAPGYNGGVAFYGAPGLSQIEMKINFQ